MDNYTFKSIRLKASNLSALEQFYINELGLHCNYSNKEELSIQFGLTELIFEMGSENVYHFAINIPENQILESRDWISNFCEIVQDEKQDIVDFPNWNAHSVYFLDPAGNIVEFIARHNLKNSQEEKFSAKSLLEISEMGICVDDLKAFDDEVKDFLGFDIFWGNHDRFMALGHENCLLICVGKDRAWFPTENIMSRKQEFKLLFQNKSDYRELSMNKDGLLILKA